MEGGARSNSGNRIRWTLLPRRGRVRADDEKVYVRDCWLTPEWKFLRAIINPIGRRLHVTRSYGHGHADWPRRDTWR